MRLEDFFFLGLFVKDKFKTSWNRWEFFPLCHFHFIVVFPKRKVIGFALVKERGEVLTDVECRRALNLISSLPHRGELVPLTLAQPAAGIRGCASSFSFSRSEISR